MFPRRPLATLAALAVLAPTCAARADDRTGTWSASALVERWAIGDWGAACGPRPSPQGAPGGVVAVRESGGELAFTGAGRPWRTTECWEQMPGLARVSHAGGGGSWRTVCATAKDDPRQAKVVTTLTAGDETMDLDETGQYQFVIQGQNCTASVRRSRNFTLLHGPNDLAGANAAPPAPTATVAAPAPTTTVPSGPTATPAAVAARPCADPGPVERIEVRPARKILRPGERFAFRATVLDALGCPADARASWSVATPGARVSVSPAGDVAVADDATDGTVEVHLSAGGKLARVLVEIASAERYRALLAAGDGDAKGAKDGNEAAVGVVATEMVGGATAVAEDAARRRKSIFVGVVGTLAAALAAVAAVLLRRGRAGAPAGEEDPAPSIARAVAPPTQRSPGPTVLLCPVCGAEEAAGSAAAFCPHDGTRLVPAEGAAIPRPVPRPAAPRIAGGRGKICPTCGGRFEGEATFCGRDGTVLVLVN